MAVAASRVAVVAVASLLVAAVAVSPVAILPMGRVQLVSHREGVEETTLPSRLRRRNNLPSRLRGIPDLSQGAGRSQGPALFTTAGLAELRPEAVILLATGAASATEVLPALALRASVPPAQPIGDAVSQHQRGKAARRLWDRAAAAPRRR